VAALVLGVTGLCSSFVILGGLLGLVGLVLGLVGLGTARRSGVGRGKAVAGLVTSLLAIVVAVLCGFFLLWYANQTQECYQLDHFQQYRQCVQQQLNQS
jgi:membrane-bound ClpP family serine protease